MLHIVKKALKSVLKTFKNERSLNDKIKVLGKKLVS